MLCHTRLRSPGNNTFQLKYKCNGTDAGHRFATHVLDCLDNNALKYNINSKAVRRGIYGFAYLYC